MKLDTNWVVSGGAEDLALFFDELSAYDKATDYREVDFDDKSKFCLCAPKTGTTKDEVDVVLLDKKTLADFNTGNLTSLFTVKKSAKEFGPLADVVIGGNCMLLANGEINVLSDTAQSALIKNAGLAGGRKARKGIISDMFIADNVCGKMQMIVKTAGEGQVNLITNICSLDFARSPKMEVLKNILQAVLPLTGGKVLHWEVAIDHAQISVITKRLDKVAFGFELVCSDSTSCTVTPIMAHEDNIICAGFPIRLSHDNAIDQNDFFTVIGKAMAELPKLEALFVKLDRPLEKVSQRGIKALFPENTSVSKVMDAKRRDELIKNLSATFADKEGLTVKDLFLELCNTDLFKNDKETAYLEEKKNAYKVYCYEILQSFGGAV